MKLQKMLCICICFLLLLGACTTNSYEKNTTQGEIINITLKQLEQKMKNKETFAVMLSQSMCSFCQDFENIFTSYIQDHHVLMYNVTLDKEPAVAQENLAIIRQYFYDFSSTPGIYYVSNGVRQSQLIPSNNAITKQDINNWVIQHKVDKKE